LNFLVDENEKKGSIVFTGKIKIIYPQRGLHLDFFLLNEKKKVRKKKQNYNRNRKKHPILSSS